MFIFFAYTNKYYVYEAYFYLLCIDFFSRKYPPETSSPDDSQFITMEEILQICKQDGITRLIIFDFSCSNFSTNFDTVTEKSTRRVRRQNWGKAAGGYKKGTKYKSTSRKTIKNSKK